MRAHHALALTPEPFGVFGDLGILGGDRHPDAAELVIDITPNGPEKAPRPSRARQGDVNRCPFKAVEYDPADYLALALDPERRIWGAASEAETDGHETRRSAERRLGTEGVETRNTR